MNNTIRRTLVILLFFSIFYLIVNVPAYATPVVNWNSSDGINRLINSNVKGDFFSLAPHFEGQENKVYCGVASMTIILNALRVANDSHDITPDESIISPEDRRYFRQKNWSPLFNRYSQNTVVTQSPKSRLEIMGKPRIKQGHQATSDYGLGLSDLAGLAKNHGLHVRTYYVEGMMAKDQAVQAQQKSELVSALKHTNTYAIINYTRVVLKQKGSGHFSPAAAYDKASDSFLIMDVSNTFQNWVWVDSDTLFEAMAAKDNGHSRGFVVLSEA
ncbi:phytochelatin synthase family protein [Shewanella eurypsychrophilus]|uniref:glutathione gamma-glutamylcysteinyltransferase n=1 Tax=Shewanella eurypsychrophilus TaxID=2593656 RepID=A0ABX8S483_9GAMM|nr:MULTISPECIES: phytochelatin synthase family protein [Shewanella]QFU23218.1 phytochelatin synthase [Shewanella sp. YLB-09]QXP44810.1 phytochelatin synthase family protein [Shewanella eurypsychrophilus]